jgi:putative ABC transport system permease protein
MAEGFRERGPRRSPLVTICQLGGRHRRQNSATAILGTYVLAETTAVMRTRELGIRAALGATTRSLTMLVVRESAVLVGIGLGAGLLLSCLGANVVRAFLFRVQPLDPATLGGVAALILLLAISVSTRPALRAARVDLAGVLRAE